MADKDVSQMTSNAAHRIELARRHPLNSPAARLLRQRQRALAQNRSDSNDDDNSLGGPSNFGIPSVSLIPSPTVQSSGKVTKVGRSLKRSYTDLAADDQNKVDNLDVEEPGTITIRMRDVSRPKRPKLESKPVIKSENPVEPVVQVNGPVQVDDRLEDFFILIAKLFYATTIEPPDVAAELIDKARDEALELVELYKFNYDYAREEAEQQAGHYIRELHARKLDKDMEELTSMTQSYREMGYYSRKGFDGCVKRIKDTVDFIHFHR